MAYKKAVKSQQVYHYRKVGFTSFLSNRFITVAIVNPEVRKLLNSTSIHYLKSAILSTVFFTKAISISFAKTNE